MLTMKRPTSPRLRRNLARATFAERMASHHGRPIDDFPALAWKCGASWPTRCLRPLILYFAPRYFDAEDLHLARAADCHWHHEVEEEMKLMRVSYLRRGGWRYLGIGLNGERLLRYFDDLVVWQVIAAEAKRIPAAEDQFRPTSATDQQSLT